MRLDQQTKLNGSLEVFLVYYKFLGLCKYVAGAKRETDRDHPPSRTQHSEPA
jgi:hypothetical protein